MPEDDILQEDTKDETLLRIHIDLAWKCSCLTSIVQSVVEIRHSLHGVSLEQAATKAPKDVLGRLMFSVIGLQPLVKSFFHPMFQTVSVIPLRQVKEFLEMLERENQAWIQEKYDVFSIQRLKFQKIVPYYEC